MKTKINVLCYMSMGLLGAYISVYQSIISAISKDYSISSTMAGLIISLHFIGSFIAPIILGEISDRKGKQPIVIISFAALISGLLAIYLFNNLLMVAFGIFIIGCGFAVIEGTLSSLLSDINKSEGSKVINISQMFLSIGAVIGPLTALFLIKMQGSWKIVFLLMIVLFTIVLIFFSKSHFSESEHISQVKNDTKLISVKLFKEKIFLLFCISIFIYVGIEEGIAFWLCTYFENTFNENYLGTYTLSAYWASMIIGRFLASRYSNKYDLFLKGGLLLSLIFIIISLLWQNSTISLICFSCIGFGFSAVWPMIIALTNASFPKYTGTAMGIMMTSGAGGGIVIPFLIGVIGNFIRINIVFWVVPILIIMILVLMMCVPQKGFRS